MKTHLRSSDEPLPSGGPLIVACGKEIKNAYFVLQADNRYAGVTTINSLMCCGKCWTGPLAGRYTYGVVEAQEMKDFDAEGADVGA